MDLMDADDVKFATADTSAASVERAAVSPATTAPPTSRPTTAQNTPCACASDANTTNVASAAALGVAPQSQASVSATTSIPTPAAGQEEVLRLVVSGFQKFMNAKEVTKIMKHANIEYESLKRPMSTTVAILRFNSVAQRDKAAADLVGVNVKGRAVRTMVPVDEDRRIFNKQGQDRRGAKRGVGHEGGRDDRGEKRARGGGAEDGDGGRGGGGGGGSGGDEDEGHVEIVKTLAEVVTPLLSLPYAEQLRQKEKDIALDCVGKMFREIKKSYEQKNKQLKRAHQLGEGGSSDAARHVRAPDWAWGNRYAKEVFVTEPISPSPAVEGYRNKNEFTVGRNVEGQPTVGFRLGTFRDGNMHVGGLEGGCVLLDPVTLRVAKALQAFVRRPGALPVYDQQKHEGVWRYVTVRRSQRTGQCLVWVCAAIKKQGEEAWMREQREMVEYLTARTRPLLEGGKERRNAGGEEGKEEVVGAPLLATLPSTSDSVTIDKNPASAAASALLPSPATSTTFSSSSSSSSPSCWTGITSLFLGPYEGLSNPNANDPLVHLWGLKYMEEDLLGLKFRISPHAFFQVNTAGAEVLYQKVVDESRRNEEEWEKEEERPKLILDVCCGTGTIGICAATQLEEKKMEEEVVVEGVGEEEKNIIARISGEDDPSGATKQLEEQERKSLVLGIEMCESAVEDARVNASRNGVQNAAFICSKAEDVLLSMLRDRPSSHLSSTKAADEARLAGLSPEVRATLREIMTASSSSSSSSSVIAIVDPPRNGLHVDCLRALRNCPRVQRLVYVSCNPTKSLPRDAVALCGPPSQKLKGVSFRPVKAIPVDMFPHTRHCEVIMVFERGEEEAVEEEGDKGVKKEGGEGGADEEGVLEGIVTKTLVEEGE
ncbi:23s rrna (uracil-5-)-methyltransferase [Nannochloropsis oceanica]